MIQCHTTILVIDDQKMNRILLEKFLSPEGYRIISALNGPAGRNMALSELPELILLDIVMPEEDGITTLRLLKEDQRTAHIPVILISARTDSEDKVCGFNTGAVDYITKPFDGREVIARVAMHLRMHEKLASETRQKQEIFDTLLRAQQGMLVKPEDLPDARFAVCYRAVCSAGGDFFDVVETGKDCFSFFVADISGHDLEVSFNTSAIKALFRQNVRETTPPEETIQAVNQGLLPLFNNGMHLTACLVQLDRILLTMTLVNAGHLPVIRLTCSGFTELIEAEGDILGVFDPVVLYPVRTQVKKGERLFIYTDGLIEHVSNNIERKYGIDKLSELCRSTANEPLCDAIQMICQQIFNGDSKQSDDMILLGVEV